METTSLYIEIIIIGLEIGTWFLILISDIVGTDFIKDILNRFETLPVLVILVGFLYILGLIGDRVADWLFLRTEDNIKKEVGFEEKTTMYIWTKSRQTDFVKFHRSKIRILRATVVNVIPFMIVMIVFIQKYLEEKTALTILTIITGTIAFLISFFSIKPLIKSFYIKAKLLSKENLEEVCNERRQ